MEKNIQTKVPTRNEWIMQIKTIIQKKVNGNL